MKTKKILLFLFLFCGVLTLSGCFYLRLQKVKNQLARFDQYFEIKEGQRFSLITKEPVFLPADMVKIMRTEPTTQSKDDQNLLYDYILEKQYSAEKKETGTYDIIITFVFTEDKLCETRIDNRFFAVIPKNMFIAILKALGNAKVDIAKRSISGGSANAGQIHLPDVNEVKLLLGTPYSKEGNVYTYKYLRKTPSSSSKKKEYLPAEFTFDPNGRFLKCRSEFLGGPFEIDFSSALSKNKPQQPTDSNSIAPITTNKQYP